MYQPTATVTHYVRCLFNFSKHVPKIDFFIEWDCL